MRKFLLSISLIISVITGSAQEQAEQDKPENLGTTISGIVAKHIHFKAYAHLAYQYAENDAVDNTFAVQRAIVIANGELTDKLDYLFMYDFGSSPMLHEMWGRYTFSDALEVTVGQQKVPLTLESLISQSSIECISASLPMTYLVGAGKGGDVINAEKSNSGRDIGVRLDGKLFPVENRHLLDYKVGVFNGSGINVSDNNNHKDLAAWLLFHPLKEWAIGGSFYYGKGHYQAVGTSSTMDHRRNRWAVSTELDLPKIYVRAEGVLGKDGEFDREGLYVTGLYHLMPEKLDLMLRYDYFNNHENKSNSIITENDRQLNWIKTHHYTIGINYNFYKLNRIRLHYTYKKQQVPGIDDSSLLVAQLQIGL